MRLVAGLQRPPTTAVSNPREGWRWPMRTASGIGSWAMVARRRTVRVSLPMPPLQTAQLHGGFDPSSHLHNGFHAGALRVPLADAISSLTAARMNGAGMSFSRVASAVGPPAMAGNGIGAPLHQRHAEPLYMTPSPSKVCI